ncbi:MAG: hypothetical protein ACI9YL_001891 [Luteibaculaceae bacterium]|jgi:hypothetical protein
MRCLSSMEKPSLKLLQNVPDPVDFGLQETKTAVPKGAAVFYLKQIND